ncbi:vitamin B12-transporter ATPase [Corynebacterium faecale]|uniref:AAA family ATPase n=1 Tax=Corynebacterium faecale TaxID=1758466 RepID=UPI0025B55425|nr:AAA family ATPase [Corynebacterium faecale]WJY93244.1 vitamin B12-transporter ATPase [Corynebacterium faecale]
MFLTAARLDDPPELLEPYLENLGVVCALQENPLKFRAPITVITGENGVGKSTLVEALAVGMRLNPEGGSRHANFGTVEGSVSSLGAALTLTRRENPRDAFFLRGESYFNVAGYYEGLAPPPPGSPRMDDLLKMSHGQGLMALIERRFHSNGLFFLDEPEAGLSVLRQLELLGKLYHLARKGSQIIMATHSPVLLAIPGAEIWEFTRDGVEVVAFDSTESVRAAREFVADPRGTARFMIGEE